MRLLPAAEDAAELVEVEYEPLPPVVLAEEAPVTVAPKARRGRAKKVVSDEVVVDIASTEAPVIEDEPAAAPVKPARGRKPKVVVAEEAPVTVAPKARRGRAKKVVVEEMVVDTAVAETPAIDDQPAAAPVKAARGRKPKAAVAEMPVEAEAPVEPAEKPKRGRKPKVPAATETPLAETASMVASPAPVVVETAEAAPPRSGWWQRTFGE